jgi:serine/threonine protein kinase
MSSDSTTDDTKLPPVLVKEGLKLGPLIGTGAFAKVYRVEWNRMPDKQLVIKIINHSRIGVVWKEKCLNDEMEIMRKLSEHPNIVKSHKCVKTRKFAYIVMDFAPNGSIGDYLKKMGRPLKESKVKPWFADILSAVTFAHSKGVAHRDLKPDNFLLNNENKALLSDFGFACFTQDRDKTRIMKGTYCGSAQYMAPELHSLVEGHAYDAMKADVYSLGVCLFEMINFFLPFGQEFEVGNKNAIKRQKARDYKLKDTVERTVSQSCKDLIDKLLEPNPKQRIAAKQALEHEFITRVS